MLCLKSRRILGEHAMKWMLARVTVLGLIFAAMMAVSVALSIGVTRIVGRPLFSEFVTLLLSIIFAGLVVGAVLAVYDTWTTRHLLNRKTVERWVHSPRQTTRIPDEYIPNSESLGDWQKENGSRFVRRQIELTQENFRKRLPALECPPQRQARVS